ncbi:hypothetical protein JMUB7549_27710 [Staphylococcus aureus]
MYKRQVPGEWIVPIPQEMSIKESMVSVSYTHLTLPTNSRV